MAISKEELEEILNGEGDVGTKTESILAKFNADFDNQLNAIKVNKEEIKKEKQEVQAKLKAAEGQISTLESDNKKLQEQLKANSPEESAKIFEQKLQEAANAHAQKELEMTNSLKEKEAKIEKLERNALRLECMKEFNKAIAGKNIDPDAYDDLADRVLGLECSKFAYRPIGDNKEILATVDGLTIDAATKAVLETNFGKRCVTVKSTGGNAEGGVKTFVTADNPFITGNLTKQMELARKDPEMYKALKAQAGK